MLEIQLRRHSQVSLARQLYQLLRDQMTAGQLPSGELLPSTRELARQLEISRNTAYEAYEMLSAEGYIVSRPGSQTRVADGLCLEKTSTDLEKLQQTALPHYEYLADFRTGQPDLSRFPRHLWLQLQHKAAAALPPDLWGYSGPEGFPPLREEIAVWLLRSRGLVVRPADIFITAGATQALYLLGSLFSLSGTKQSIIVEDPCHMGMLRVLQEKNFKILPVPVDKQGLQTAYLPTKKACAIYVTPSHQFPLGGILPANRRAELIRFARDNDLYIIEDDYDSEFRYSGTPVAPLHSLDAKRVIYVGTFSKILFPALRIGYMVLPPHLHSKWCHLRTYTDVQNPLFEQAALADYLHSRKLDRHVRQMRRLYGQRRESLLQTAQELFGRTCSPWGDAAGLHLVLELPGKHFDAAFARDCQKQGIYITPVDYHSICKGIHLEKLALGYGHLDSDKIKQGLLLLNQQIEKFSEIKKTRLAPGF